MIPCLAPNGIFNYTTARPVDRILVGTIDGVRTLVRENGAWRVEASALEGEHISSLLCEPLTGSVFAGVHGGAIFPTEGGIFFSGDDGRTWERRNIPGGPLSTFSLSAGQLDGKPVIYAGTEPARLFRSFDLGKSWEELTALQDAPGKSGWMFPDPRLQPHVKFVAPHPTDPSTFFVGVEQGDLLKTTDGGRSFVELDSYWKEGDPVFKDVHMVAFTPSNPEHVYLATGQGLYFSEEGGENFKALTGPRDRISYADHVHFAPEDERILFMAGSQKNPFFWLTEHVAGSAVIRSKDRGMTWELANNGLPDPMDANIETMGQVRWPGGYALFAGNTDGEVYLTEDGAENWTLIARDLPCIQE